jgi:hypothetical protein
VVKKVLSPGVYHITARNKFLVGGELESVRPSGASQKFAVARLQELKNEKDSPDSKPGYDYIATFDVPLEVDDLFRVRSPEHDLDEN